MLYLIWLHWMRRCDVAYVGAEGGCRAEGGGGLEGPGWSSKEAAGERAAAGAVEARECSGVFSVHSGQ